MIKKYITFAWIIFIILTLYLYFFHPVFFQNILGSVSGFSIYLGFGIFLILGSLRGFALIPVTSLILIGLLFFNPLPLFILTMIGIIISSFSIYYFSEFMRFDIFFEKKYPKQISRLKSAFSRNELPIIIFWSAAPFLPTDLICYVAGTLRVNLKKLLLGVFIGEGIMSGLYIFFGYQILQYFHL